MENELMIFDPKVQSKRFSNLYRQVKSIKEYVERALDEVPADKRSKINSTIYTLESSMDNIASVRMIFETMEMNDEVL